MREIGDSTPVWTIAALALSGLAANLLLAPRVIGQTAGSGAAPWAGASGARLYEAACATCHGMDGRGRTASELGFDLPLPDFTDCDFGAREPDSDWLAVIHDGGPARGFDRKMPAFGSVLTDAERQAALDHVRTLCIDPNWPRGELNVPRALFTEKAFPEDEAVITTSVNAEGPSAITQKFTWEQRFGPRSQIELSLPWVREDLGAPLGSQGGFSDLTFAFKHALYHSLGTGSILSLGGELVLPTGDEARGFGKGTTVLEPYVLFAKLLPGNAFIQFQGTVELPLESGLENELVLRTAIGKTWTAGGPIGRAWTPMIEVLAGKELTGGATAQWDLVPQVQVSLSTRQHILANVGFRVPVTESSDRNTEFVFYLLWDWFDGGLTEGW